MCREEIGWPNLKLRVNYKSNATINCFAISNKFCYLRQKHGWADSHARNPLFRASPKGEGRKGPCRTHIWISAWDRTALQSTHLTRSSVLDRSHHQTVKIPHLRPSTRLLHSSQPCPSWGKWASFLLAQRDSRILGKILLSLSWIYGLSPPRDGNLVPSPLALMDPVWLIKNKVPQSPPHCPPGPYMSFSAVIKKD